MTMTIEDLKTLMDEFDPAVLLPELDTVVGKVELVARIAVLAGPVILLLLGLAYLLVYLSKSAEWPHGNPEALQYSLLIAWVSGAVITTLVYKLGKWRKKAVVPTLNH